LASRHTVIAPDLRGYGRTDKPRDGYDKRTMATDVSELVRQLGFERVSVVGHDRGGRVAHRWAWIVRTRSSGSRCWTSSRPARCGGGSTRTPREYVRAFSAPGALRAGFDDYRASFPTDADHDETDAGRKIPMPVLAMWGEAGLLDLLPALEIWRDYAEDVDGVAIAECGHFLAEEQPAAVVDHLGKFLS
jgi:pimeloyl-ACP methyl ester carboxylesterase